MLTKYPLLLESVICGKNTNDLLQYGLQITFCQIVALKNMFCCTVDKVFEHLLI